MKKRIISTILALVLVMAVVIIPSTAIAEAAPFWTGGVSASIAESLLVSLPASDAPIITTGQLVYDAGSMVVGQIKTFTLRVRNMPSGVPTVVTASAIGYSTSILTVVITDPQPGVAIQPTYPAAAGFRDYTFTITAVAPSSTPYNFNIQFSRP
jgi:hypothetical protein